MPGESYRLLALIEMQICSRLLQYCILLFWDRSCVRTISRFSEWLGKCIVTPMSTRLYTAN